MPKALSKTEIGYLMGIVYQYQQRGDLITLRELSQRVKLSQDYVYSLEGLQHPNFENQSLQFNIGFQNNSGTAVYTSIGDYTVEIY